MIIETQYKKNDTVTIKSLAGEEIVARFVEDDMTSITVEKPMAVMMTQNGPGLGPWTFTVNPDSKYRLNRAALLFVAKTDSEMAKQYVSATSNIQMV